MLFKLFDAQIVPTLLYGAEIWGYRKYEQIERVHRFACNCVLHVCNKTPHDVIYEELGRYTLFICATIRFILFGLRLLGLADNLYSKKAHTMLLVMQNRGSTTCVSHVKSVLCDNGFEQVKLFGCGNDTFFFKELKERTFKENMYLVYFVMAGVITFTQVKGYHCTQITITVLK